MKTERVLAWMQGHRSESLVFDQLHGEDALRDRIVGAILAQHDDDEAFDDLHRFGEALVHCRQCLVGGTLRTAPEPGQRRPHDVWIPRMKRRQVGSALSFRVEVRARDGWSGYFDTTVPQDVARIAKLNPTQMVVIVGEVVARPYDCLVEFDARTRLV